MSYSFQVRKMFSNAQKIHEFQESPRKSCQYEIEQTDSTISLNEISNFESLPVLTVCSKTTRKKFVCQMRFKKLRKNSSRNSKEILPNYKLINHIGQNLGMKLTHFLLSLRYIELLGRIVFARWTSIFFQRRHLHHQNITIWMFVRIISNLCTSQWGEKNSKGIFLFTCWVFIW